MLRNIACGEAEMIGGAFEQAWLVWCLKKLDKMLHQEGRMPGECALLEVYRLQVEPRHSSGMSHNEDELSQTAS